MNKLNYLCLLGLFILNLHEAALGQFSLTGEIRPRSEFRNGFKSLNTQDEGPAFFVEQRSRLYADYQSERLGMRFTLQDVRIWGGTAQLYKADPSLVNVYEAWGEYQLSTRTSIRVGRQALDYDNARFLGDLDWAQQGRSHDAIKLMYQDSTDLAIHIGAAFNQNVPFEPAKLSGTFYEGVDNYKTMQYLWMHKDWEGLHASFLFFNDGRQLPDSAIAFRQTYGMMANRKFKNASLGMELYYQGGKDAQDRRIDAWLVAVQATVQTTWTPITLGVDYLSGATAGDSRNKAFVPLYGTNHKFYGWMDYFYVGNNHGLNGNTAGLLDMYLQTNFKLTPKSAMLLHYHHFQSPTTIYVTEGSTRKLSASLGDEFDLVFNLNFTPEAGLKVGYSQLFSTASLEVLKNKKQEGLNQWGWVMLTVKPTLFTK